MCVARTGTDGSKLYMSVASDNTLTHTESAGHINCTFLFLQMTPSHILSQLTEINWAFLFLQMTLSHIIIIM